MLGWDADKKESMQEHEWFSINFAHDVIEVERTFKLPIVRSVTTEKARMALKDGKNSLDLL